MKTKDTHTQEADLSSEQRGTAGPSWRVNSTRLSDQPEPNKERGFEESELEPYRWRSVQQNSASSQLSHLQRESWRASIPVLDTDEASETERAWRAHQLSDTERESREEERRVKMGERAEKRARRAEEAKRSWSKRAHRKDRQRAEAFDVSPHETKALHSPPPLVDPISTFNQNNEHALLSEQDEADLTASRKQKSSKRPGKKKEDQKTRPPIDGAWVREAALRYLGRFTPSEAHLSYILHTKIKRAEARVSEDPAVHQQWVQAAVEEAKRFGGVNDELLARGLVRSAQRRGLARGAARLKLKSKKLSAEALEAALDEVYTVQEGEVDPTLSAAARAAQKKRLGPWGPSGLDYAARQKQLAALARRGFHFGIAKKVLEATLEEAEVWARSSSL